MNREIGFQFPAEIPASAIFDIRLSNSLFRFLCILCQYEKLEDISWKDMKQGIGYKSRKKAIRKLKKLGYVLPGTIKIVDPWREN